MMKKKTIANKVGIAAAVAVMSAGTGMAQTNLGAACGCPPVGSRTTVNLSTLADANGDLLATNTVLSCDKTYIIDDKIYVMDGQTITIPAGTLIKGAVGPAGDAHALVVTRGGKIFANGTQECPIVFTAQADPMDGSYSVRNRGMWGGVVILGRATNNLTTANAVTGGVDGVGFIEGYTAAEPRALYGMPVGQEDDDDNSGVMTYVSIRHAGQVVGANNELNGLTLGSVGRGTTLRNIEVVANADDGIEFFGGTVDLKYGSCLFLDDDMFDWDQGYVGRGQFWFGIKTDQINANGDNGFECDGDDDAIAPALLSHPVVYNATLIGNAKDNGFELKELTEGEIYSSIVANYAKGVAFSTSRATDAYNKWVGGQLKVECNTFVGNGTLFTTTSTPSAADSAKFFGDGNSANLASLAGFDFAFAMNDTTNTVSNPYDAIPNPAVGSTCIPPVDGFFSTTNYRGAFNTGEKNWLSDWSLNTLLGTTAGLAPCPTDINADGVTNNVDFLQLLGKFNQSCP